MPDALDKAAEAVRQRVAWFRDKVCHYGPAREGQCGGGYWHYKCNIPILLTVSEDIARAVLEATGYDEAIALVEELRQWVHSECASITLYGPDDCKHCAYRPTCKLPALAERIKAALARAGKEDRR